MRKHFMMCALTIVLSGCVTPDRCSKPPAPPALDYGVITAEEEAILSACAPGTLYDKLAANMSNCLNRVDRLEKLLAP